jgi:hypothetical protein
MAIYIPLPWRQLESVRRVAAARGVSVSDVMTMAYDLWKSRGNRLPFDAAPTGDLERDSRRAVAWYLGL